MEVSRRLVAVFAADVEGYSRLMGTDEVGTLKGLTERRAILDKAIADHRGRIANTAGDSVLAEFASAVDAVRCAVEAQAALAEANANSLPDKRIVFRIGIHVGDVMVRAGDLFGDGVNIAARLQTLAAAGGVCVSAVTYDQVRKILPVAFTDLGPQQVKNIEEPVRVYAAAEGTKSGAAQPSAVETSKPLPLPDKPSIAVLPFQNMSGDPEQEYFADGMVEDIITALSRFKSLFVIARNSSFTYKGKAVDIKQVGRELGVRYVLEGSVRKAGNRVRITGQLIEAATGAHIWADKFEGLLEDIFEVQDNVTTSLVGAIAPKLTEVAVERIKRKPPANWDSYDHYLRGVHLRLQWTLPSLEEAYRENLESIKSDPSFGPPYAIAALCIFDLQTSFNQSITAEQRLEAARLAEQAVTLAPDDSRVLAQSTFPIGLFSGDPERAAALAERATVLNPNDAAAWNALGWMLAFGPGEHQRAFSAFGRALRINPIDPVTVPHLMRGQSLTSFLMGQYEDGMAFAKKVLSFRPTDILGAMLLSGNALFAGRAAETKEAVDKILQLHPALSRSQLSERYPPLRRPEDNRKWVTMIEGLGLPE